MTTPDPSDETFGRIMRKFGGLIGSNYEGKVAHRSVGMACRRLRLRDAEIMAAITKAEANRLNAMMCRGGDRGVITDDESGGLAAADIIMLAHSAEGVEVFVVAEVSTTLHDRDVDRARARADIIRRLGNLVSLPAVIGSEISDAIRERAAAADVHVIHYEYDLR